MNQRPNVKCKMIKLVEKKVGEKNLCDLGFGDEFLSTTKGDP